MFLGAAALQIVRTVTSPPEGLTPAHSHVVTIVLVALWLVAAIATFTRKQSLALFAVLGTFAFLPHLVISLAARGSVEIAYLIALPFQATLVWSTFKPPAHVGSPEPPPPRASSGRLSV